MRMTFIKSRHIERFEENGRKGARYHKETAIDATSIMGKYANFNFGSQVIDKIELCALTVKDSDGRKQTIVSVKF